MVGAVAGALSVPAAASGELITFSVRGVVAFADESLGIGVGDILSGFYTFEGSSPCESPDGNTRLYPQDPPGGFSFSVGRYELSGGDYEIRLVRQPAPLYDVYTFTSGAGFSFFLDGVSLASDALPLSPPASWRYQAVFFGPGFGGDIDSVTSVSQPATVWLMGVGLMTLRRKRRLGGSTQLLPARQRRTPLFRSSWAALSDLADCGEDEMRLRPQDRRNPSYRSRKSVGSLDRDQDLLPADQLGWPSPRPKEKYARCERKQRHNTRMKVFGRTARCARLRWITWEHQRRSLVLAEELGADLVEILPRGTGIGRYLHQIWTTALDLVRTKPEVLFVQNPSMVLAVVGVLYGAVRRRSVLVVDRHSNFFPLSSTRWVNAIHDALSRATIRHADLTIVTNDHLRCIVESVGGHGFVLEDKIPNLLPSRVVALPGICRVLYACSFDSDEPYLQVFEAARLLGSDTQFIVTGNYRKTLDKHVVDSLPSNVILAGYLDDQDYINHLFSVDVVLALTDWDYTLLCSAYEAVSAGKPLILSNKGHLTRYFSQGVVTVDNTAAGIAQGVTRALSQHQLLAKEIAVLKKDLDGRWRRRFEELRGRIDRQVLAKQAKEKRA